MKLYIKQKMLSWNDKFTVKDEAGQDVYMVEGEIFTLGKKLHVYDMNGFEAAYIEQKLTFLLSEYQVYQQGVPTALIRQKFSFLHPRYEIDGLGWEIEGAFWMHEYEIRRNGMPIVTISKEWMTWGDSYMLDIANPEDALTALAVVLVIDCVAAQSSN